MECSVGLIYRRIGLDWLGPARQKLCFLKRMKKPFANSYEFPGGKLRNLESPYDALIRELSEEIGVNIDDCVPIKSGQKVDNTKIHVIYFNKLFHKYVNFDVTIHVYLVSLPENYSLISRENRELVFKNPFIDTGSYIDTTYRVLRLFEIPNILYISDTEEHYEKWSLEKYKISALRIRKNSSNNVDYETIVKKYLDEIINNRDINYKMSFLPKAHNHRLIIIDDVEIYSKLSQIHKNLIGGIHYKSSELMRLTKNNIWERDNKMQYISCSCHNEKEVLIARNLNVDFILISPVLKSKNKKQLGWEGFKTLANHGIMPSLALGGINNTAKYLDESIANNGVGIAGISNFWDTFN